jgi:diaminohydroxyphosphoribosylaminopyrimidine deaminase/5-amino-6-(5-phosphoribosylamino)uracil reductase
MQHALRIGARHLGRTWPNPSVGCVLVKNDQVLSVAASADGGRPHAEPQALEMAGDAARGATAYVTLEPCAHYGKTPPCAQALIDAGIARVVYACEDHDDRVAGKGIAMLRAANIAVDHLPMAEAERQHRGFFRRVRHGLPYVAMKLATSADGQMIHPEPGSQWITGEQARSHGHRLRAQMDAVLTGIGTVLADDPRYNVRLPGLEHARMVRVVADRQLRIGLDSTLVKTAEIQPLWVLTTPHAIEQMASHASELRTRGVVLHALDDGAFAPKAILALLASAGITRLLVEAGPRLSSEFLEAGCVDTLYWYRAPTMLGNTGQAWITALHSRLNDATRDTPVSQLQLGGDTCDIYELATCLPD